MIQYTVVVKSFTGSGQQREAPQTSEMSFRNDFEAEQHLDLLVRSLQKKHQKGHTTYLAYVEGKLELMGSSHV